MIKRFGPLAALLVLLAAIAYVGPVYADDDDSAVALVADDDDSATAFWTAAVPDDDDSGLALLPTVSDEQAAEALSVLMQGETTGFGVLAAAFLSLLIFALRKTPLLSRVPKKALPWLAACLAMAADVLTALLTGMALGPALAEGLLIGAGASGFWEMALKHMVAPQPEPEPEKLKVA